MPLLIAGIDEAGYGPMLGPLCVGMTLFRVRDWEAGSAAPDLWKLLERAVCRKPADARRRIPVADSKALKLANDCKTRHPLIHLERGVLSFLRNISDPAANAPLCADADLFGSLGATFDDRPWYATDPTTLPLGTAAGDLAIHGSVLGSALESAGVEILDMRCCVVPEGVFNQTVREAGSKAAATALAVGRHLRTVHERFASPADPAEEHHLRIVCDQLGGRTQYADLLSRELPGCPVQALCEADARSRYQFADRAIVQFMPEAEEAHLPVALASMTAKLVRELAMMRFNRYWCSRVPDLKPTAGYTTDARRWLHDMHGILHPAEREAMVRIA